MVTPVRGASAVALPTSRVKTSIDETETGTRYLFMMDLPSVDRTLVQASMRPSIVIRKSRLDAGASDNELITQPSRCARASRR
jgi:hypothetical protein